MGSTRRRLLIQQTTSRDGTPYTYFFCQNRRKGTCPAPYVNTILVEEAIEDRYARIRVSPELIADVRADINEAIAGEEQAARLLHQQLTAELQALDVQEDNLINLAAAGAAQAKIQTKLHEIQRHRRRLTERLNTASDDLSDSAHLIEICLTLLENPHELYRRCDEQQRRLLNQAIFQRIYIEDENVTDHELHEPFASLQPSKTPTTTPTATSPTPTQPPHHHTTPAGPPPTQKTAPLSHQARRSY